MSRFSSKLGRNPFQNTDNFSSPNGQSSSHMNNSNNMDCPEKLMYVVGEFVWGKLGKSRWWPALIISAEDCKKNTDKPNCSWVFWFGDHTISNLQKKCLVPFKPHFKQRFAGGTNDFKRSIHECLAQLAEYSRINCKSKDELIQWAKSGFPSSHSQPFYPIPEFVKEYLQSPDDSEADGTEAIAFIFYKSARNRKPADVSGMKEQTKKSIEKLVKGLTQSPSIKLDNGIREDSEKMVISHAITDVPCRPKNEGNSTAFIGDQPVTFVSERNTDRKTPKVRRKSSNELRNFFVSKIYKKYKLNTVAKLSRSKTSIQSLIKNCKVNSELPATKFLYSSSVAKKSTSHITPEKEKSFSSPANTVLKFEDSEQSQDINIVEIQMQQNLQNGNVPFDDIKKFDVRRSRGRPKKLPEAVTDKTLLDENMGIFQDTKKFSKIVLEVPMRLRKRSSNATVSPTSETKYVKMSTSKDTKKSSFLNDTISEMQSTTKNYSESIPKDECVEADGSQMEQTINVPNKKPSNTNCKRPSNPFLVRRKKKKNFKKNLSVAFSEAVRETEDITIIGSLVWAKLGSSRWWPAMIISGDDCNKDYAACGQSWVYWFGDHIASVLSLTRIVSFRFEFNERFSKCSNKLYMRGVDECLQILSHRMGFDSDCLSDLIEWAKGGFLVEDCDNLQSEHMELEIPDSVREKLDRQYFSEPVPEEDEYLSSSSDEEADEQGPKRKDMKKQELSKERAIEKMKKGELKIEEICIACDCSSKEIAKQHPLFCGGLCEHCKNDVYETLYAHGSDGNNIHCVICGQYGELFLCDNPDCAKCYCYICVGLLCGSARKKQICDTDPWICFFCTGDKDGFIEKRKDCDQHLFQFFIPSDLSFYLPKRRLRVLSLFDGIATGKYALDQLGLDIEIYYASEINKDAIHVAKFNHGECVIEMGDVENLEFNHIKQLCPIDILLGGSPCNDLSLVNPARKGLQDFHGSGRLFYEFYRIKNIIEVSNKGRHLFWLFENVSAMPLICKTVISRFFDQKPTKMDAKFFSAMKRSRLFWGNIPGMQVVQEYWEKEEIENVVQKEYEDKKITLDNYLTEGFDRQALVQKLMTITTNSNSLKQGKKDLPAVKMDEKDDKLWITEIEKLFGLPCHYTDVGNLSFMDRLRVLGKGWSVPVIKYILRPLTNFFASKEEEDEAD